MLAVTDVQVQKLYWAMTNGEWHLQLRPPLKAADSPENVESVPLARAARGSPPGRARRRGTGGEPMSENTRIYVTGSCDGLDQLREGLATHPSSTSSAGASTSPRRRPPWPAATSRSSSTPRGDTSFPAGRGRGDPRAHPCAGRDPRLGRVVGAARGGARRRGRRRRPAPAAADRERRLRAAQGGATPAAGSQPRAGTPATAASSPCSRRRAAPARR